MTSNLYAKSFKTVLNKDYARNKNRQNTLAMVYLPTFCLHFLVLEFGANHGEAMERLKTTSQPLLIEMPCR
jgi:hypothetical protein